MIINNQQLKDFVLDSGLVPLGVLDAVDKRVSETKTYLGDALVLDGSLTADDLRRMEAYILGIPFVSLKGLKINFEVLSLIPEPIARKSNIVAFKKTPTTLEVAMLDTDDLSAIEFVKKKVGLKILPRLTDKDSMKGALLQYQKSLKAEFGDIIEKEANALNMVAGGIEEGTQSEEDLRKLAEDLPVVKIVDTLLNHAILQGASDIHVEPTNVNVIIRYRIDGILHDAMVLPKTAASGIVARIKVLANLKLDEKRLPQDGRFKIESAGEKVAFRVSTLPVYYGEKTVMRLLRESVSGYTLEGLGFHGIALERIHQATKQRVGMILATGPTGSGKSTTLYTLLDIVNSPDVNISTIEDPIEYQMARVNQTQVKSEIGLTFASGLRTLMRQDPDIIMVGEIRDTETASLAINAALTGHLVLSTLHTNSAAATIPRLIDMNIEPFLIVSTINVIISQRLVRRLAASKEKYFLTDGELAQLKKTADLDLVMKILKEENLVDPKAEWKNVAFYRPIKSEEAVDGYKGRIGIHEVIKMSPTIRELIMKGGTAAEIETQARSEGMLTMLQDGIVKAVQGLTTIEEILRVVSE